MQKMINNIEKISLRKDCNSLLDNVIDLHISLFPDLRYIQNLWALGIIDDRKVSRIIPRVIVDRYYEEPYDTIVRILPKIVDIINNKILEKSETIDRNKLSNICTYLEKLGFAKKISDFKLEICS